jgi:thioredoxin 2
MPVERLADAGRCGKCHERLPAQSTPIDVDQASFDSIVRASKVPVLIDFWANWCAPCRMAAPEVQKVAKHLAGQALVLKVDTEQQQALAARFNIRSIPTFMVLRDGKVLWQHAGVMNQQQLEQALLTA